MIEPLLDHALSIATEERSAFLDQVCDADSALREEVERMVAECTCAGGCIDTLLERPAAETFASLWDESEELARLQTALAERYVFEHEAGRGGMGTVYRARELRHRRPVGLKVLRSDLSLQGHARFRREIELAANLQHPHIVPVFDSGDDAGRLWYTMPFVEGESLGTRLRREGPLPLAESVRLLRQIVGALAYAHERGVVHRDLKPDNVLLSGGHALVTDFGVARAIAGNLMDLEGALAGNSEIIVGGGAPGEGDTRASVPVGTRAYMAPEQAAGHPDADHRVDLYALGVIAYEMIAGVRPPASASHGRVAAGESGSSRARPPDGRECPPAIAALIARLLEKEASNRPPSAGYVLAALETVTSSLVVDRSPSADDRISRGPGMSGSRSERIAAQNRQPRPRAVAGAVVVLVLGLAGTSMWVRAGRQPALHTSRVLVVPFDNATGDSSLTPLGSMAADWIAAGIARAGIVEVASDFAHSGAAGEATLRQLAAENGAGTVISGTYYVDGDSIRLQARVTDASRGTVLHAIAPVSAPRVAPNALLEPLRQRVMAVLAVSHDPRWAGWEMGAPPPTYAAYEQYVTGRDRALDGDWRSAIAYFGRAVALDSAYVQPMLGSIDMYVRVLDDPASGDSLARLVERRRETLTPIEQAWLDRARAEIAGDHARAVDAARAMARAAPGAHLPQFLHGAVANRAQRPREALEALSRIPPRSSYVRTSWGGQIYWEEVANAHHVLADYESELEAAHAAREFFPDNRSVLWLELRALAALGTLNELSPKLDALERTAQLPGVGTVPALLVALGEELDVHGQRELGRRVLLRALAWQRARSPNHLQTSGDRAIMARSLYLLNEYDQAERLYSELAVEEPTNPHFVAAMGFAAAGRGAQDEAEQSMQRLRTLGGPYARGRTTYARAELAAQMGDVELALTLLRQALAEGLEFSPSLHADPSLAPLRADPRFRQLLEPKG